ncbi:MAG: hypothetical protein HYT89_00640 [Candidatus Omnitrophica bacterium]|nr:hypothetical protein [Candidatus Omnitrophota bacterium]
MVFKKISDLLCEIGATLLKDYQSKAVDLAKIETASLYIRGIKALREHFIAVVTLVFSLLLLAFAVILIPLALVLCMDWTAGAKVSALGVLSVFYIGIPWVVVRRFLSEKTWMRLSKSDELLEKVVGR